MDETEAGTGPQPDPRRQWAVGSILFALVALILAAAFLLSRHFESHVGIEPVPGTPSKGISTSGGHKAGSAPTTLPATAATPGSPAPTRQPTPPLSPRQEVRQAYHRYWKSYSQVLYTLDASGMPSVAADGELQQVQAQVAGLRRERLAVHVMASHHLHIISLQGSKATIFDEIRNRSITINPITKQPPHGSKQVDVEKDIYYLQKIHGTWKVVKSLREER